MKTYIYYNMCDSTEEPHGTIQANSYDEACEIAPILKNMDSDAFHDLFIVTQKDYIYGTEKF